LAKKVVARRKTVSKREDVVELTVWVKLHSSATFLLPRKKAEELLEQFDPAVHPYVRPRQLPLEFDWKQIAEDSYREITKMKVGRPTRYIREKKS
jgi:hypothetical protein